MPPRIRAIGNMHPLRDPFQGLPGKNRAQNLRDHHQTHHPHERHLKPVTEHREQGVTVKGYQFHGRFVEAGRVKNGKIEGFVGGLAEIGPKRESDIAVLALEKTFGKAASWEELTVSDWFIPENRDEGRVFMQKRNGEIDRILVMTKEGFTLSIIGTNVVEAAVYLIRMYEAILKKLEKGDIPEGVESAEIEVEGVQEEYALVASPLHIKCRLPNLANIHESELDRAVEDALNRALGKKRFQVIPR